MPLLQGSLLPAQAPPPFPPPRRGTSFATPLVAGAAAMLLAAAEARGKPATYLEVRQALCRTADPSVGLQDVVEW